MLAFLRPHHNNCAAFVQKLARPSDSASLLNCASALWRPIFHRCIFMLLLWFTTAIWAFSFSLIGVYLSGQVDSYFLVFSRVLLATLVFTPFLLRHRIAPKLAAQLMLIGAVQLGLMYIAYYHSFLLLTVPEILIFTITTPIYITLIYDALVKKFHARYLISAVLAVAGAAVIRWDNLSGDFWLGFLLVQASGICFAFGQVGYKVVFERLPAPHPPQYLVFGWFYLGALIIAVPAWLMWGNTQQLPNTSVHWGLLLWLGVVASGLGFFMWNKGSTQVNSGQLATMNNMLIPAGLLVNIVLWNHDINLLRLSAGGCIMLAALLGSQRK